MLCSRCGQDNPEQNRYCGMCGSRLESARPVVTEARKPVPEQHSNEPSRPSSSILGLDSGPPRRQQPEPSITGPSFLGLGTEPGPSGTSYLLEDDEPRSHRGLWITLALLLAIGLVSLQFRTELRARAAPLYAAAMARVYPTPPAPPVPSVERASAEPAAVTHPDGSAVNDAPAVASVPPDAAPQPAAGSSSPPPKPDDSARPLADEQAAAKPSPDASQEAAPEKSVGRAARLAHAGHQTRAEAVVPEESSLLRLAQKYIRGQGVHQDCRTGLAYLREAMKHPSAAAASQMGALYATGTCVPLDRVAAYRYFGSALRLSPNNSRLAQERDQLYAQMSSAERREADRQ